MKKVITEERNNFVFLEFFFIFLKKMYLDTHKLFHQDAPKETQNVFPYQHLVVDEGAKKHTQ